MEQNAFMSEGIDVSEKLSGFRKNFTSAVAPEHGSYGITRIVRSPKGKNGCRTSVHRVLPRRKAHYEKRKSWKSSVDEDKL